jgi:hypothetical protein
MVGAEQDAAYERAMALVAQIDDDGFRLVAAEAIILARVKRGKGYSHPGGHACARIAPGSHDRALRELVVPDRPAPMIMKWG